MNVQPYSNEWYHLRKTKIGASDAYTIMGINKYKTLLRLMEEKLGLVESEPMNQAMQRGLDLEDDARNYFFDQTSINMVPKIVLCTKYDWMFCSLDGINFSGTKILEIKCPGKTNHNIAKKGKIPDCYYPQVQHQLSVTGLPMCYYLSYDGMEGIILEIDRNDDYIEKLIQKEKEFYQTMLTFVDDKDLAQYHSFQPLEVEHERSTIVNDG